MIIIKRFLLRSSCTKFFTQSFFLLKVKILLDYLNFYREVTNKNGDYGGIRAPKQSKHRTQNKTLQQKNRGELYILDKAVYNL